MLSAAVGASAVRRAVPNPLKVAVMVGPTWLKTTGEFGTKLQFVVTLAEQMTPGAALSILRSIEIPSGKVTQSRSGPPGNITPGGFAAALRGLIVPTSPTVRSAKLPVVGRFTLSCISPSV